MENEYPEPIMKTPEVEELEEYNYEGVALATDGCEVEPDGICPHGYPYRGLL